MERFEKYTFPIIECISCLGENPIYHTGIRCPNEHHICINCSQMYLNSMLSNHQTEIPAKWSYWKEPIDLWYLQYNMTLKEMLEYLKYQHYWKDQYKNRKTVSCFYCNYFEYWEKSDKSNLFFLKIQNVG